MPSDRNVIDKRSRRVSRAPPSGLRKRPLARMNPRARERWPAAFVSHYQPNRCQEREHAWEPDHPKGQPTLPDDEGCGRKDCICKAQVLEAERTERLKAVGRRASSQVGHVRYVVGSIFEWDDC